MMKKISISFALSEEVSKKQQEQHAADQREEERVWQEAEGAEGVVAALLQQHMQLFRGIVPPRNHYKPAELLYTGHAGIKVPTEGFKQVDHYKLFLTQHKQTIETAKSKPGGLKKYACLRQ